MTTKAPSGSFTLYDEEAFNSSPDHEQSEWWKFDLANYELNQIHSLDTIHDRAESAKWEIPVGFVLILLEMTDGTEKQYACWGTNSVAHLSNHALGRAIKAFRIVEAK